MSLYQSLNEFRFNLETLNMLVCLNKSHEEIVSFFSTLKFNTVFVSFLTGHRNLLNSVLLRLQLYSDQNFSEQNVRTNLAVLNNPGVNSLVDYLYCSVQNTPLSSNKLTVAQQDLAEPKKQTELTELTEEEEDPFDTFFNTRVRESEDPTNVVKMSEMYTAFTSWWTEQYDGAPPGRDELKEFLSNRLGRQIKTTVTNVSLA